MGRIEDYLGERLRGREIPEDLRRLVELELDGHLRARDAVQPFAEVHVLAPGELHALEEPQDDEDASVIANGRAITEVLGHMAVVVDGFNGDLFGYWMHPDEPPADDPPIVKLDTEGQFSTPEGATLVEAMVFDWLGYDDDDGYFSRIVAFCERHSIPLRARHREQLSRPETTVDPVLLHDRLYRRYQPYTVRPAWAEAATVEPGAALVGLRLTDEPLRAWLLQHGYPDPESVAAELDDGMGEIRLQSTQTNVNLTFYLDPDQGWWLFRARFGPPAQDVPFGFSFEEDRQTTRVRFGAPVRSALIPVDRWRFGHVDAVVAFDGENGTPKRIEFLPVNGIVRS